MGAPANPVIATSVREAIVAAAVAALNGSAAPMKFWRSRVDAFGVEELPAGLVHVRHEQGQRRSANVSLRKMTLRVEIQIAAPAPADQQLDGPFVYVVQTLTQSDALRAAGVLEIDNAAVDYDIAPAYQDAAAMAVDFEIAFAVLANDPTVKFSS